MVVARFKELSQGGPLLDLVTNPERAAELEKLVADDEFNRLSLEERFGVRGRGAAAKAL